MLWLNLCCAQPDAQFGLSRLDLVNLGKGRNTGLAQASHGAYLRKSCTSERVFIQFAQLRAGSPGGEAHSPHDESPILRNCLICGGDFSESFVQIQLP